MVVIQSFAVGEDHVALAEAGFPPYLPARRGLDADQVRDRPRRPHVVEAVEVVAGDDRGLPLAAQEALGAERLPPRPRHEPLPVGLEIDEHRAVVLAGRHEHAAVDGDRRRRVAAEIGLEREAPQHRARPWPQPHHLGAGDAHDLLRPADVEQRRRRIAGAAGRGAPGGRAVGDGEGGDRPGAAADVDDDLLGDHQRRRRHAVVGGLRAGVRDGVDLPEDRPVGAVHGHEDPLAREGEDPLPRDRRRGAGAVALGVLVRRCERRLPDLFPGRGIEGDEPLLPTVVPRGDGQAVGHGHRRHPHPAGDAPDRLRPTGRKGPDQARLGRDSVAAGSQEPGPPLARGTGGQERGEQHGDEQSRRSHRDSSGKRFRDARAASRAPPGRRGGGQSRWGGSSRCR